MTGATSGQGLSIGQSYPVKAIRASTNWLFARWTDEEGNSLGTNPSLTYLARDPNQTGFADTITANFTTKEATARSPLAERLFGLPEVGGTLHGFKRS